MYFHAIERANPQNRDEEKFYLALDYSPEINIIKLSEEISYASSINLLDVRAVLESLLNFVPEHIMNGNTVRLGDFGIFKLGIVSKGVAVEKEVTAKNILRTHILFRPGQVMWNKIQNTKFIKV